MVDLKIPRENANDDFVLITKVNVKDGDKVNYEEGEGRKGKAATNVTLA